jgi:hypothetical protein
MKKRNVKPRLAIAGVLILLFAVVSVSTLASEIATPESATATRMLPTEPLSACEFFTVRIEAFGYGVMGQVVETLPEGFKYVTSTLDPGSVEVVDNTVKFSLFGETSFNYSARASDTEGTYYFSGILIDEDLSEYEVGGDTEIVVGQTPELFDTGQSPNPYPSIFGTHNGTIQPYQDITVHMMYTYPCQGTGGHSEYVAFYNATTGEEIANGTWKGYAAGNYQYIEFVMPFDLHENETYDYTIKTGSYPQIIHAKNKPVIGGTIACSDFTDANGKRYEDWIPAIRLE